MSAITRRSFTAQQKLQVVLESLQRDTTIEAVCRKYAITRSLVNRWRDDFFKQAETLFADKRSPSARATSQGYEPGQSPEELKRIIGEYATQLEILKKAGGLLKAV
jgi:transposase-like protein